MSMICGINTDSRWNCVGRAAAFVVGGFVAPVVSVLALIGGVPYYLYKKHELNGITRRVSENIDRLCLATLTDQSTFINGKNYMNHASQFDTDEDLKQLRERLQAYKAQHRGDAQDMVLKEGDTTLYATVIEHNCTEIREGQGTIPSLRFQLQNAKRYVDDIKNWITTIALGIFFHVGVYLIVDRYNANKQASLKQSSFEEDSKTIRYNNQTLYVNEREALNIMIDRTKGNIAFARQQAEAVQFNDD